MEQGQREALNTTAQQIQVLTEQNDSYKKEIESLKQGALDREDRFKNLFKNAKERIVSLTEQVNMYKNQAQAGGAKDGGAGGSTSTAEEGAGDGNKTELLTRIDNLEKEKEHILEEKRQDNERYVKYKFYLKSGNYDQCQRIRFKAVKCQNNVRLSKVLTFLWLPL